MTYFSNFLSEKLKGINLSQLSRELQIPPTLLFEWRDAKRNPSFKNLKHVKKIASYFNTTLDDILFPSERQVVFLGEFSDGQNTFQICIDLVKSE